MHRVSNALAPAIDADTNTLTENISLDLGSVPHVLIERRAPVPATGNVVFSTGIDDQEALDLHVIRGNRAMSSDNISIGVFRFSGFAPRPAGVPQIEIRLTADGVDLVVEGECDGSPVAVELLAEE